MWLQVGIILRVVAGGIAFLVLVDGVARLDFDLRPATVLVKLVAPILVIVLVVGPRRALVLAGAVWSGSAIGLLDLAMKLRGNEGSASAVVYDSRWSLAAHLLSFGLATTWLWFKEPGLWHDVWRQATGGRRRPGE